MDTGQWLAEGNHEDNSTFYPIVLKDFNGTPFITCAYLVDNQCTNFDSDGNDLRYDRCKNYYCHDDDGVFDTLTPHVDVDIIKIIVDNVYGTNLVGEWHGRNEWW